ncbi:hypothetical protein RYX36_033159 [Vicia faba]
MGIPQAMVALRERASFVKDSLHRRQTITDNMVSILVSFDHRLSALETEMRPTQIKTHSIQSAHDNIDKTLKAAETAQETFGDFEEAVEKYAIKTVVQDRTVHPLTSYVVNYVKFLYGYRATLKQLFQEFDPSDPEAQLASVTTRICNVDYKKKQFSFLTQQILIPVQTYTI